MKDKTKTNLKPFKCIFVSPNKRKCPSFIFLSYFRFQTKEIAINGQRKQSTHNDGDVLLGHERRHLRRFPMNRRFEELWETDEDGESVERKDVAVQHAGPGVVAGLPVVVLDRVSEIFIRF